MELIIALFVLQLIFFIGFIVFSMKTYKKINKVKYDMRNTFPYEFNFHSFFKDNAVGNIALVLYALLSVAFYGCLLNSKLIGNFALVVVSGIVTSLMSLIITFVPLKLLKTHMVFSVILFATSFATLGCVCYVNLDFYSYVGNPGLMVLGIVSAVVAVLLFCLLMNPKLSIYIKMEERKNEDGSISHVRPKWFMMAFTEWAAIFANIVAQLLIMITFILINI